VVALPLLYRSVLAGFEQVDEYQIQAAKTLGFSSFQIFYRVLLPEARQSIVSGSILSAARGLGEFGATAMLAGNIIGKTRTLPLAVYSAVMSSSYDTAAFYAIILIIISLIAIWGLNFYSARMERRKKNARR
jgi:molybdate transport system permease protein